MHFLDPSRPIGLSGRACYVAPDGRAIGTLPRPEFEPLGEDLWLVRMMLLVGHVTAKWYEQEIRTDGIILWLQAYAEDPEAMMRSMGWEPPMRQTAIPKRAEAPSLEDLGL